LLLPQCVLANASIGSGESGKSTIVKQMKIIHQNGYSRDELALYRLTIYKNLVDCAKALIGAMQQFETVPQDTHVRDYCDYLLDYTVDPDPHRPLDREVGEAVVAIYADPAYSAVMEHQSEFYLMDSAP
jgi:guanine nucleotide-binding protein G(i) subunit alpha